MKSFESWYVGPSSSAKFRIIENHPNTASLEVISPLTSTENELLQGVSLVQTYDFERCNSFNITIALQFGSVNHKSLTSCVTRLYVPIDFTNWVYETPNGDAVNGSFIGLREGIAFQVNNWVPFIEVISPARLVALRLEFDRGDTSMLETSVNSAGWSGSWVSESGNSIELGWPIPRDVSQNYTLVNHFRLTIIRNYG
jgi:hypothetical protein